MNEVPKNKLDFRGRASINSEAQEALEFILPLSGDYPNIDLWFKNKVTPGLIDGTRHIIKIERDGQLVGIGIAKSDGIEQKICTVRVRPDYVGRGIGIRIFDRLLKWLNTDQPHLSVSEHNLFAFERIFDWYGFKFTSRKSGLYLPDRSEVLYNETKL